VVKAVLPWPGSSLLGGCILSRMVTWQRASGLAMGSVGSWLLTSLLLASWQPRPVLVFREGEGEGNQCGDSPGGLG